MGTVLYDRATGHYWPVHNSTKLTSNRFVLNAGSKPNHLQVVVKLLIPIFAISCFSQPCTCIGGPGSPDSRSEVETPKRSQTSGLPSGCSSVALRRGSNFKRISNLFPFLWAGGCNFQPASSMACSFDPNSENPSLQGACGVESTQAQ